MLFEHSELRGMADLLRPGQYSLKALQRLEFSHDCVSFLMIPEG